MNKKFYLFGLLVGLVFCMVAFTSCGGGDDDEIIPPTPPAPEPVPDPYAEMVQTPLTFEAIADGTITFANKAAGDVTYSIDGGEAHTIASQSTEGINIKAGQTVAFFGDNNYYNFSMFKSTADFYAYGNIMSLVSSTDYANAKTLTELRVFSCLFYENTFLKSHPSKPLVLPATTLSENCYESMFSGCTGMTIAPALPATTLADYCYNGMFMECTGLTTAPALPAMNLAEDCYGSMFRGCTGLTTAPALPATTLTNYCYSSMFMDCTSLTTPPALPATTVTKSCYMDMFYRCSSLTTAPALPATTLAAECYSNMFNSCTSLTSAPTLPAQTLTEECYMNMFTDCTKLRYVKCLAKDKSATDCTWDWLYGVDANGIFIKAASASWTKGSNGIPSTWTVESE